MDYTAICFGCDSEYTSLHYSVKHFMISCKSSKGSKSSDATAITVTSPLGYVKSKRKWIDILMFLSQENSKECRKNWARLIQKICEVDPLSCPKCQGTMNVFGFIEDKEVIEKILKHLGLWLVKKKPSPKANAPPHFPEIHLEYSDSQLPPSDDYLYVDEQYPEAVNYYKKALEILDKYPVQNANYQGLRESIPKRLEELRNN